MVRKFHATVTLDYDRQKCHSITE